MTDALTIHEAAETTGWSPRMLRYIERNGLIEPQRSAAGYRLYGAAELQRLRTLKELLGDYDLGLGDIGFALRLRRDHQLAGRGGGVVRGQARASRRRARRRLAELRAGEALQAAGGRPRPTDPTHHSHGDRMSATEPAP